MIGIILLATWFWAGWVAARINILDNIHHEEFRKVNFWTYTVFVLGYLGLVFMVGINTECIGGKGIQKAFGLKFLSLIPFPNADLQARFFGINTHSETVKPHSLTDSLK